MLLFPDLLTRANDIIAVAGHYCLLWLAHVDGHLHDAERRLIKRSYPLADASGADICAVSIAARRIDDLELALRVLREKQHAPGRVQFMALCVDVVLADGRVSIGERHALCFLADVLQVMPTEIEPMFLAKAGFSLLPVGDLSSGQWWADQQARQYGRGDGASDDFVAGPPPGNGRSDTGLADALRTLGLKPTATAGDVTAAYRRLAGQHHPDRFAAQGEVAARAASDRFVRIRDAYETAIKQVEG